MKPEHRQRLVELTREVLDLTQRVEAQIQANSLSIQMRIDRTNELLADFRPLSRELKGR